jgi:two-component system, NtrC family, sensor histidine kinase HydH
MRLTLLSILRVILLVFLIFSSFAIIYATNRNIRTVESLATLSLESTALSLSSSAESALRSGKGEGGEEIRQIFSDRVVAYALIADKKGQILFHTNPRLSGSLLSEESFRQQWPSVTASGRRITLGTGLPGYEFNYLLHAPDGAEELLRLVLHTASADKIVGEAQRIWWTVAGLLIFLWAGGGILERLTTHHYRLQSDLEKKSRLALIGQMTAVLAHEIRNALGSLKGFAQWVEAKMDKADPRKAAMSAILQGTKRIEDLVGELLLFSREEKYYPEDVDPAALVREILPSLAAAWKGKIVLETPFPLKASGDKEKTHRVLVNGIQNALQAMGEEGVLRISVQAEQSWVKIQIEDTGPGIPQEELPRLFTPFHTTKTNGTGLGLAYSQKVVEGMGGRIELENREDGSGAVLKIYLPKIRKG